MCCENCEDIREKDGAVPDCETELGCRIPPLSNDEARVMKMREMLRSLNGLVDSAVVLRMFEATMEDVKLLAAVEDELRSSRDDG